MQILKGLLERYSKISYYLIVNMDTVGTLYFLVFFYLKPQQS